jgi:hypothetical protein
MGLTTLPLMRVVAALEPREPKETIFKRYTIERIFDTAGADQLAVGDLPDRPDRSPSS